MTLSNLILYKTGHDMSRFARMYGLSYNTLRSWSLPKNSLCSRSPNESHARQLAGILRIPVTELMELCNR